MNHLLAKRLSVYLTQTMDEITELKVCYFIESVLNELEKLIVILLIYVCIHKVDYGVIVLLVLLSLRTYIGGYYSCVVPNGTKYVYFPTWDEAEGTSKVVWHQGTVEANNYAHVSCDLSSDKDTTNYATHVYAMDANGNQLAAYGTVYNTLKNKISVTASNPNIDSLKISCNSLPTGTTSVSFQVYPENNSTLVKNITCQLSGNTVQTTLKYSDFNYTSGSILLQHKLLKNMEEN